MTYHSSMREPHSPSALFILLDAARHWRQARRLHKPVQPALYARLRRYRCEQLAPVLDSLMTLSELVLGHPFRAGHALRLSPDEEFLIDMVEGRPPPDITCACSEALARAFCSALLSTRIIMEREISGVVVSRCFGHA